jgi:hypothetical protein
MPENICRAMHSLLATVIVTFAVSLFARPRPVSALEGLVYGLTPFPSQGAPAPAEAADLAGGGDGRAFCGIQHRLLVG